MDKVIKKVYVYDLGGVGGYLGEMIAHSANYNVPLKNTPYLSNILDK